MLNKYISLGNKICKAIHKVNKSIDNIDEIKIGDCSYIFAVVEELDFMIKHGEEDNGEGNEIQSGGKIYAVYTSEKEMEYENQDILFYIEQECYRYYSTIPKNNENYKYYYDKPYLVDKIIEPMIIWGSVD